MDSVARVKRALRDLSGQLDLLNHRVGTRLDLKDIDLGCLDLVARHGPLTPTSLARQAGLHPATVTGVLDRLERAGWVVRERDPTDRRGVRVRALPTRVREVVHLYGGMNRSLDAILASYDDADLATIADFLERATQAGGQAIERLR
jgi:DNA-binding MarR family transcriptional regulator